VECTGAAASAVAASRIKISWRNASLPNFYYRFDSAYFSRIMREMDDFIPMICFRFDSVFSAAVNRALAHMPISSLEFGCEKTCWFDAAGFTGGLDDRFTRCPLGKLMGMRGLRGGHYSSRLLCGRTVLMVLNCTSIVG
jgi:hypothetical protein